eukprot:UN11632
MQKRRKCVVEHRCSGCNSKDHAAKFCSRISAKYNWTGRRSLLSRRARDCLACGSQGHGAKDCRHLLENIKLYTLIHKHENFVNITIELQTFLQKNV